MRRNPRQHELPSGQLKRALFRAAETTLDANGWKVTKEPNVRASSVRRIEKTAEDKSIAHVISIRTSQNGLLGLTRDHADTFWNGLSDAAFVLVSCVDNPKSPQLAILHLFDAPELVSRFSSEYAKRRRAGVTIKPGTGFFLELHQFRSKRTQKYIGGDSGILPRAEHAVALDKYILLPSNKMRSAAATQPSEGLTIKEATRGLAITFGVDEAAIRIVIKSGSGKRPGSARK